MGPFPLVLRQCDTTHVANEPAWPAEPSALRLSELAGQLRHALRPLAALNLPAAQFSQVLFLDPAQEPLLTPLPAGHVAQAAHALPALSVYPTLHVAQIAPSLLVHLTPLASVPLLQLHVFGVHDLLPASSV